jgi:hypothetical protein
VCVPVIEQASSDAFNGRNQTISFDRVPFPLASRNSPDFAFNLSITRLQINRTSPTIRCAGTVARKLSQLNLNFVTAVWGLSYEVTFAAESNIKELRYLCLTIQTREKKKTRSHPKTSKFRLSRNRLLVLLPEPRLEA